MSHVAWPPLYTLKKHAKSRHVKLKASIRTGIELVVPLRFNLKNIPDILESNRAWIEKQILKIQSELETMEKPTAPEIVALQAIGETWNISYIKSDSKKIRLLCRPGQELVVFGDIDNIDLIKSALEKWVKNQAKIHLVARLTFISEQTQLNFSKVVIRNQRSRWGSCSSTKAINLNYKLLFLPAHLSDHILIHELCHTVHMNHSAKFWRLVSSFDALWKEHSREIRRADKFVPSWAQF